MHLTQSAGYRAPEVVRWNAAIAQRNARSADEEVGPKMAPPGPPSDMWAFGCLLFETVAGRKLFRAGDKLSSVLRFVIFYQACGAKVGIYAQF